LPGLRTVGHRLLCGARRPRKLRIGPPYLALRPRGCRRPIERARAYRRCAPNRLSGSGLRRQFGRASAPTISQQVHIIRARTPAPGTPSGHTTRNPRLSPVRPIPSRRLPTPLCRLNQPRGGSTEPRTPASIQSSRRKKCSPTTMTRCAAPLRCTPSIHTVKSCSIRKELPVGRAVARPITPALAGCGTRFGLSRAGEAHGSRQA
jgi:hypothetical protein